ncbi:tetratricopeptide repeat protein 33 isoform X2 [Brassica napus]|uniref:tetratricopeptide repeat protein 33 isoform X2 n=1 Tax=Brassica napus TaxID=3708 RepID=UPI000BBF1591|nr:tetratricopeptide repeat protein 33 isoform X2 [Brassica napus]
MKLTWNKNPKKRSRVALPNILDVPSEEESPETKSQCLGDDLEVGENDGRVDLEAKKLADSFRAQGDKLAEEGRYEEALGKWEAALSIVPENAVIHEQKAQVFLEIGDPWKALMAATRATELDPSWVEAWTTLGRAQLNFGEPDSAIRSFETALSINIDLEDVLFNPFNRRNQERRKRIYKLQNN